MLWRLTSVSHVIVALGNDAQHGRANLFGRWVERSDVIGGACQALSWSRGQLQQRHDTVGHGHERDACVRPDETRVRYALGCQHGSFPARSRTFRPTARSPPRSIPGNGRSGSRHDRSPVRRPAACRTARSNARAARNTACCTHTSSSAAPIHLLALCPRAVSSRGPANRTRQSKTDT